MNVPEQEPGIAVKLLRRTASDGLAGGTDVIRATVRLEPDPVDHLRGALGKEAELLLEPVADCHIPSDPVDGSHPARFVEHRRREELEPVPLAVAVSEAEDDRGLEPPGVCKGGGDPGPVVGMNRVDEPRRVRIDLVGAEPGDGGGCGVDVSECERRPQSHREGEVLAVVEEKGRVVPRPRTRGERDHEHGLRPRSSGGTRRPRHGFRRPATRA